MHIHTHEENNFVMSLVPSNVSQVFLGYKRSYSGEPFLWEPQAYPAIFTNWKSEQPELSSYKDCVVLDRNDNLGEWMSVHCYDGNPYVCKKDGKF